jgi:hypothetical protein
MKSKEKNSRISTRKQILFSIIAILFLLFIIEGLLSIYVYQKTGPEKVASIESLRIIRDFIVPRQFDLDISNHNLVRPDSPHSVNHRIAQESVLSNRFGNESWVEFRNMDFDGDYMHMKKSVRRSAPEAFYNPLSADTIDIYFFGGSTMFGFNVLDNETIPSQFVQLYKQKFPAGKSIRVYNYGVPMYYSYQELILLSNLIYNNHKPDIAIFLDGINDFWFGTASYYRQSYFSYIFRQMFNKGLRSKGEFKFMDTASHMHMDPKNIPLGEYNDKLVSNYFENVENIKMMCNLTDTKPYFLIQPSPFYNYKNQQNDPICFKDTNTRFNTIYPLVKDRITGNKDFVFMGDMLENEKGYPFIDGLHYSPAFIKKVALGILDEIEFGSNVAEISKNQRIHP